MGKFNLFSPYAPYGWEQINLSEGTYIPSELNNRENASFAYWQRAFFQRAASVIKLEVPKEWEGGIKQFLYWCLTRQGFVYVGKSKVYGKFFQPCTINGFTFYYQPTRVLICNPYNKDPELNKEIELDKDGALLKWTPDFRGIWDIINMFAEKMALMNPVIDISIRNNAMSWVYMAKTPQAAASFKKAMDEIYQGKPGVVVDKDLLLNDVERDTDPFSFLDRKNIAQSYINDKLLQDWQTILNAFDAEVGIPTVPYAKKERMVTSEAESRQTDSKARSQIWLECLQSSIEHINDVLGEDVGIKASLRYDEEVKEDELGKDDNTGDGNMVEGRE